MKRTIDIVVSIFGLVFVSIPAVVLIVFYICENRGPILFFSKRIGRGNTIFRMVKFRSMKVGTPLAATHLLHTPEQWLTPVGALLRRTSFDEVPQLWNVLKGEMSLVGPRPALCEQEDLIHLRTMAGVHRLKPGITGWAQVNGRDALSIADKAKLDSEYLKKCSVRFDLWILWLTLLKVLRRDGVAH